MQMLKVRDENKTGRICYIIEAALEYFISILVTGAYLARVTAALGFSDSLTGILTSFVSLGCVAQLGAIALFRRARRVKTAILGIHIVNQSLFAFVCLLPVLELSTEVKTALFLVCFCAGYALSQLALAPKTPWLLSFVADGARGRFTATKEMVSLLSGMTFTFVMGSVIDALDAAGEERMSFIVMGGVLFVLMILHTLSLVPVREQPAEDAGSGTLRSLFKNRMYLRTLPVILLWYIASGCATPFYGAYQIKELGFSMTFVSFLSIAYSVVRIIVSPWCGRYADRTSFSRMVSICFCIAGLGFLVNCFTVPENGKVFYTVYYCLSAVSMAGINSSLTNLIYDCVGGSDRRNALAISYALGGVCGFGATCLMSPIVDAIQQAGNRLMGIAIYPAQFVSAVACLLTALLTLYLVFVVIPAEKKARASASAEAPQ